MDVLVTGGTGFVGSHIVAELARAGHRPRLLARRPERVTAALDPLQTAADDVVQGDVLDRDTVRRALDGCQAAIHAANIYSFDRRERELMARVNERGTDVVLGESIALGLDPIVHVSSYVALLPSRDPLTPDSPIGSPVGHYASSKARAERIARAHQAAGAPVVVTHPGFVLGPHDPHLGESTRMAVDALKGRLAAVNRGPLPIVDVRDVAAAHAGMMEPGRGPRRYVVTAHDIELRDVVIMIGQAGGRRLRPRIVPTSVALATGRAADALTSILPVRLPIEHEGPWIVAHTPPTDSDATAADLGVRFRPAEETFADTVRWLVEAGHVRPPRS